jgi:pimeloyl-ACP methyl ester carboxylesterase
MENDIRIGSRNVHYLERDGGGRDARRQDTLLLIHAFPLHAGMWVTQLDAPPPGWRVIAPDLPGFGRTDPVPNATSLDDYAADVIDLLDALHVGEAVIGGLSMGGYVVLALFRLAPQYFRALLLADTRATADTEQGRAGRARLLERLGREGQAGVADEMLPKLLGPSTMRDRPEVAARVREMILSNAALAIATAARAMRDRADSAPLLPSIHMPVLIAVGEEDPLTPVADSREMQRQIAGSRLEIIPAAGHLSNLERPDAFNASLVRFLSDQL